MTAIVSGKVGKLVLPRTSCFIIRLDSAAQTLVCCVIWRLPLVFITGPDSALKR
jgi:hypothetical protein